MATDQKTPYQMSRQELNQSLEVDPDSTSEEEISESENEETEEKGDSSSGKKEGKKAESQEEKTEKKEEGEKIEDKKEGEQGEKKKKEKQESSEKEVQSFKEEKEKLLNKIKNQEKLLSRLGYEVGILRKQNPEEDKKRIAEINEAMLENPVEGQKMWEAYKKEKKEEAENVENSRKQALVEENKNLIEEIAPDLKDFIPEIIEIVKSDGADNSFVKRLETDTYSIGASLLFSFRDRALKSRTIKEQENKIKELNNEIEDLKSKPEKLLEKLENRNKFTISNKTGGGSSDKKTKNPYQMSRQELEESLRE